MNYTQISQQEAWNLMLTEANVCILDVREAEEYAVNRIPGAVLLPHERTAELAPELLRDKSQTILVYCRSGRRSKIAAETLAELGYSDVREFGGIIDWPYTVEGEDGFRLEEITPENWRPGLSVADNQKGYVSDSFRLLARAFAYRENRSRPYIISADDRPVGMALYYDCEELNAFVLSQLFIDARCQRKSYGERAVRLLLSLMEQQEKYEKAILCYIEGNTAAKSLFEKLGFVETGERDGDEIIMEYRFPEEED